MLQTLGPSTEINLNEYRWENRLLLIFDEHASGELFQDQEAALLSDIAGLIDRDLKVFLIRPNQQVLDLIQQTSHKIKEDLYAGYKIPNRQFTVILIGKDGTVKLKEQTPITNQKLFAIIDAMPMRQAEMKTN